MGRDWLTDATENEGNEEPGSKNEDEHQVGESCQTKKNNERECCRLVGEIFVEHDLCPVNHGSVWSSFVHVVDTKQA